MKYPSKLVIQALIALLLTIPCLAQDSLIHVLLSKETQKFNLANNEFHGEGWEYIQKEVLESTNVLIGEDHFSNEIPLFAKAIFDTKKFDNFIIEVDPYSTQIICNTIRNSSADPYQFYNNYKDLFSFYALQSEFELLEYIVNSGTKVLGSDQIVAYADRLIFHDLITKTKNKVAREIYLYVTEQSKTHFEKFLKDPQKQPMYFMTPDFEEQINKLDSLDLKDEEEMVIQDIKKSISIYKSGGHLMRIQLIKHHLMKEYRQWHDSRNLYKYGAMHMARGESFLTTYDIGNIIANIAESNYEKSYHIMVIGESGMIGAPFRTFPQSDVNIEEGFMKSLRLFFDVTKGKDWYVFNLIPIREAIDKGKVEIEDVTLSRLIKGYDSLVIIPKLTPARF